MITSLAKIQSLLVPRLRLGMPTTRLCLQSQNTSYFTRFCAGSWGRASSTAFLVRD